MAYIYSLCDGTWGQDFRTVTRLERINRALPNGVDAPHLEHRQTCSSSPSSSQSFSPPSTPRSPRRNTSLLVPYLASILQATRWDAMISACLPPFTTCRVLILPDPSRCSDDLTCICSDGAFIGAVSSCVWQSCSDEDAQTTVNYWAFVCRGYRPLSSGTGDNSSL